MSERTFRMRYEDNGEVIKTDRLKAWMQDDICDMGLRPMPRGYGGSLDRTDHGEMYERAKFITKDDRVVLVDMLPLRDCRSREVQEFLANIAKVCEAHNLSLSHEDGHGAFQVVKYDTSITNEWMSAGAHDMTSGECVSMEHPAREGQVICQNCNQPYDNKMGCDCNG